MSNHRYHTREYYQADPILSGNDALQESLDAAHARSTRVVLDGVFKHTSHGFYQFQQTSENGIGSSHLDWFHFDRERIEAGLQPSAYPGAARQNSFGRREDVLNELLYRC